MSLDPAYAERRLPSASSATGFTPVVYWPLHHRKSQPKRRVTIRTWPRERGADFSFQRFKARGEAKGIVFGLRSSPEITSGLD